MPSIKPDTDKPGLHRATIEALADEALEESGGDEWANVTINYTFLLELLDCYRASGWIREPTNL